MRRLIAVIVLATASLGLAGCFSPAPEPFVPPGDEIGPDPGTPEFEQVCARPNPPPYCAPDWQPGP